MQQPRKKPKGHDLDVGDTFLNGVFSVVRIVVEHCTLGFKRRRIVKDVLRNTKGGSDRIME